MRPFQYASPKTKEEAVQMLGKLAGKAAVLAGGTDLLSLLKDDVVTPSVLVNVKSLKDARGIQTLGDGTVHIGALTTLTDLIGHADVRAAYPSLVQAARSVHSVQIRNAGTVGGDLCQRPRCWYFRKGFGLLPKHNGQSMVVEGDNRYHAILGAKGDAYFVHPSSLAPVLITLGASLAIFGGSGEREVKVADFYRVPSGDGEKEYNLAPDEIVLGVKIPKPAGLKTAIYEVREREVLDWPLVHAAVSLQMSGSTISKAHVVLGHVAPIPWVSSGAAAALAGKSVDEAVAAEAGKAAVSGARALSRNGYKIRLAQVAVKRALLKAVGKEV